MNENSIKFKCVKAIHPFKPTHTDELSFQKGDIIQVTQMIEGGWWEGMLNGTTGWFPSNYVTEATGGGIPEGGNQSKSPVIKSSDSKKESGNRDVVLQSLHGAEKTFITDMEKLVQTFLKTLESKFILPPIDNATLISSLEDVILLHTTILRDLEAIFTLKTNSQRIGHLFLKLANQIQNTHRKYCSIHPKMAILLQSKKEEVNSLIEGLGVQGQGLMTLTSFLSKPLRRLERYSSVMQEVDRHSEESHPDRTDLLKAINLYRDIYHSCNNVRRQKELEQDVLCSEIKGWEGEPISQLGDIQLISHCRVISLGPSSSSSSSSSSAVVSCLPPADGLEKKDRLLILCPGVLIFLSVSSRTSGYCYENKIPTYGTMVSPVPEESEQFPNAFEIISGSTNVRLLVSYNSQQEKNKWLQVLRQPVKLGPAGAVSKNIQQHQQSPAAVAAPSAGPSHHLPSPTLTPSAPPSFQSNVVPNNRASAIFNRSAASNQSSSSSASFGTPPTHSSSSIVNPPAFNPNVVTLSQSHFYLPSLVSNAAHQGGRQSRSFGSNLRPYPPLRPSVLIKDDGTRSPRSNRRLMGSSRKKPVDDTKVLQEDALMLKVIESYCTSAKNRQAVNSSIFDGPQVLIAEEEKIILEEARDNQIVVEERTLVDTVYSLRDQVKELKQEQMAMRRELESERSARKNLEILIRQALKTNLFVGGKQEVGAHLSSDQTSVATTTVNGVNNNNNGTRDA